MPKNRKKPITKAAKFIRRDIEEYCHKTVQNSLNSPPRIEEFILHKSENICIIVKFTEYQMPLN